MGKIYVIQQNPGYGGERKRKAYLVKWDNGEKIGTRNLYGIIEMKPERVRIDRDSFNNSGILEVLIEFLGRREIEIFYCNGAKRVDTAANNNLS